MRLPLKPSSFLNSDVEVIVSLFHKRRNLSHIFADDNTDAWRGTCLCGFYTPLQSTREVAESLVNGHVQELVIEAETALKLHKQRSQEPPVVAKTPPKKKSLLFRRD